ncbi:PAS domain-containing protein [Hymenobacter sp. GOD-10R]|uniref:PAS domain-containing protein n=1 Tax=Hymenobacter sp. GOD-10R TaxID=3093922 RepID=UPI002D795384|nr:PAS domain-containing protein [Hymenobacter sp. GOD-10R]WRQ28383.1 PAS domain-containing protein [Hymenobacter sp. GOD-10R]
MVEHDNSSFGAAPSTSVPQASLNDSFPLSVFNALPDAYVLLSPELIIQAVSDAYLAATLTQRKSLVGKHLFEAFPDNPKTPNAQGVSKLRASLQQVLATGQPHRMAVQHYDVPDPECSGAFVERHWEPLNTPVFNEQGHVCYLLHQVVNVTEKVRTQDQLRESKGKEQLALGEVERQQLRLERFFLHAPALIAMYTGPDLVFEFVNPRYQEVFQGRELLGKKLLDALPELINTPIWRDIQQVYRTGETLNEHEVMIPVVPANGGPVQNNYYSFTCQARTDAQGRVEGLMVYAYEVTEQVHARRKVERLNQELEERVASRTVELRAAQADAEVQRKRLYDILMQLPAMIVTYRGPNHVYDLVNPYYQQLFSTRQLHGRPIREALPELKGQAFFDLLDQVYRTGEPFYQREMEVYLDLTGTGKLEKCYYNVFYQATRDASGNIDGILNFASDVTSQVVARQQIEKSEKALRELNEQLRIANEEMAAMNEELTAANEEIGNANVELVQAQQQLAILNAELEVRVVDRTAELQIARMQAERQREQLYKVFMEAPEPIVLLEGPAFTFQLINPAYQRVFPARELQGKPLFEALPELAGTNLHAIFEEVYQTGNSYFAHESPYQIARTLGGPLEEFYWSYTLQARRAANGKINGLLIFAHDVTRQVHTRQAMEENARRFETLLESIPQMTWTSTPTGELTFFNATWYAYTGLTPQQSLGAEWQEVLHPDDALMTKTAFEQAFAAKKGLTIENRYRRGSDGEYRWHLSQVLPVRNDQGAITLWVGTATDINDRKQVEHQLQALNEELRETNRILTRTNADLDNFVYAASHDLKQPINNIVGLFGELRRSAVFYDPEEELLLSLLDSNLTQLNTTINDLATVVRVERQNATPPAEGIDVASLATDVLQTLQTQVRTARAEISTDFTAVPEVWYTPSSLRTILFNLLSNALKYRDPTRRLLVQIRTQQTDCGPVLEVQDNGLGIDMKRYGRELFHLFRRFHHHVEGTGVGLYLINRLVEGQEGRIEVESKPGEGTLFRVYLTAQKVGRQ